MKRSVLTRYRVMAYVTGVLLILLVLACIGQYVLHLSGAGAAVAILGTGHGWLYVVYLACAFDMGSKAKMPFSRLLWILLAGTVPTAAFFVERRVTRELEPLVAAPPAGQPAGV
jgi:integral membrane protein